jgi:hypothetical protein
MSKTRIKKKVSSVSIVTISQYTRFDCLQNLYELIKLQTYKNIIEWVIVEGSNNDIDGEKSKNQILEFINSVDTDQWSAFKINYIEYTGKKLSDLRNLGNTSCIGDIIVCMDDDDYYPSERVSSAVEALNNSSCLIAGCSDIYLYEYFMNKLYKFKGFHQYHSTNNCMAFKKEYLLNHKHESGLIMSEEKSFTNDFKEPMVQLNSKKCIIVSSHNYNTFNKRELCIGGSIGLNPTLFEVNLDNESIYNYIPENFYNKMKSLFYKEEKSEYDIVYYTGGFGTVWDPKDKTLGGSEQAIVNLSEYWASIGKKVAVYANILSGKLLELKHNNVDYFSWKTLPFNHTFNTIILWRFNGFFSGISFNLRAKNIFWDLHDNCLTQELTIPIYKKYRNKITKILFKSNYHKSEFENFYKVELDELEYLIIMNGIRVDKFSNNWDNVKRNPFRFCYVSYYSRGLQHIIPGIWNLIKFYEPRAELHVYYGMEMIKDNNFVASMKKLLAMPGIIDHGRQSVEMIIREKYMSSFQLYITNTNSEIDCISIRESLVTGCIPLISNFGVFNEREGIHFDCVEDDTVLNQIGMNILNLLQNQDKLDSLRNVFRKSETIISWADAGQILLNNII